MKYINIRSMKVGQAYLYRFVMFNTPGTRVIPGFRDQTLAIKSRKKADNQLWYKKLFKLKKRFFYIQGVSKKALQG